jgi:beta-glucosidase
MNITRFKRLVLVAGLCLGMANVPAVRAADSDARARALLSRMTLDEKIGQMMQLNYSTYSRFNFKPPHEVELDAGKLAELVRKYHIGSLLNGRAIAASNWVWYSTQVQDICRTNSRLGIPILYGIDHMHGASYVSEGTIFPHALNMAATFNPMLVAEMSRITALESADLGHHWIFAPLGDLGLNPQWPRLYETFGEDPHVCAVLAAASVRGIQNHSGTAPYRQAACAKHFLGYSAPAFGGWDRAQAEISDQTLHEFHLPPFKAMVDAGVMTVMVNSGEINGVPVHTSRKLLTGLLREQLGFQGVTVTDWEDLIRLVKVHKVAANEREATFMALNAGIDMAMTPYTTDFHGHVKALVADGRVTEERINQSVQRVLRLKYELGLFAQPAPTLARLNRLRLPENMARAQQAAAESLVLLRNDGLLPFATGVRSIHVTGPNANLRRALCGGWTMTPQGDDESRLPATMPTVFGALQAALPGVQVTLGEGNTLAPEAKAADVIVVVAGEQPYSETPGNISDTRLERPQLNLIRAAQGTGKPVVLVLLAGRPRVITEVYEKCAAVLWAGLPGVEGGPAIADVLRGAVNPGGRLPFTYPKVAGVAVPYYHKHSTASHGRISETTLAEFGAGLSYTTFRYRDLKLSSATLRGEDRLVASVKITNTGQRAGAETALWFVTDEVGTVSRPVKQLKHFEKRTLAPGESAVVQFEVQPARDLGFPDEHGIALLEDGGFVIAVGDQKARFEYVRGSGPRMSSR